MGKSYEEIRNGAHIFKNATYFLDSIGNIGLNLPEGHTNKMALSQMMIPTIVFKAFTCELTLKALVAKNQQSVDIGHKLNVLYQKIDKTIQQEISTSVIAAMQTSNPAYSDADFLEDLDKIAKVFIDWRYYYENSQSLNYAFFDSFYNIVIKYLQ